MELRVLRYFLTLAREESISRAAEALYITQPTLSRQLAELEEELGVRLFERGKRKITLTEDGLLLRRRAEEMTELADKTERELRERTERLAGVVSVGAAETVASELLVRAAWAGVRIIELPIPVIYTPESLRASHYKPFKDTVKFSIMNAKLAFLAVFLPKGALKKISVKK